ncbi:unnamed protein product [Phytophthora lilii]|uniref:RxLR effector protein n=1 Tax=Phytophthora lilii TaxID=2077276 RepID=A0A9W6WM98_9STRA|nr:unnamed protein product [Phytophthora lilii]
MRQVKCGMLLRDLGWSQLADSSLEELVQDARVIAMLDHNPRASKHVLVIPHEHIPSVDDLTPAHYELRTWCCRTVLRTTFGADECWSDAVEHMLSTGKAILAEDGFIAEENCRRAGARITPYLKHQWISWGVSYCVDKLIKSVETMVVYYFRAAGMLLYVLWPQRCQGLNKYYGTVSPYHNILGDHPSFYYNGSIVLILKPYDSHKHDPTRFLFSNLLSGSQASTDQRTMRLSYILLAMAVSALLAPSSVVAEKASVSTGTSPEQGVVVRNEGNDRRLLRSHETTADNEERLSNAKLLKLVNQEDDIFRKWKEKGYNSGTIQGKLANFKNGLTVAQISNIVNRYRSYYE